MDGDDLQGPDERHNVEFERRLGPLLTLCELYANMLSVVEEADVGEFSSPEDIAETLGVTQKTVREWLRTGELVGIKVGKSWRVHQRDLARLLDEQLFSARKERAKRVHPQIEWTRGQCRECGILMPEPAINHHWVCSPECLIPYDKKLEIVVGRNTDEFVGSCGIVVPPY